jgi:hypothetical protein
MRILVVPHRGRESTSPALVDARGDTDIAARYAAVSKGMEFITRTAEPRNGSVLRPNVTSDIGRIGVRLIISSCQGDFGERKQKLHPLDMTRSSTYSMEAWGLGLARNGRISAIAFLTSLGLLSPSMTTFKRLS